MLFAFWSRPAGKSSELVNEVKEEGQLPSESKPSRDGPPVLDELPIVNGALQLSEHTTPTPVVVDVSSAEQETVLTPETKDTASAPSDPPSRPAAQKRFSWRALVQPKGVQDRKPTLPPPREEAAKEATARQEYIERQIQRTRSEKRALDSALVVRELIVGPFGAPSPAPPKNVKVTVGGISSMQKVQKVKAQLLEPKTAKKVIAQLRQLPSSDMPVVGKTSSDEEAKTHSNGPIHAVCLPLTDSEANEKHFAKLDKIPTPTPSPKTSPKPHQLNLDLSKAVDGITSVTASSYEKLKAVFADLDVVSLITAPDLGLGQPADAPGLFSGAVPTAKAIIEGAEEITPQLMALGYATGKSILPSHAGVYPPTDRMSVLTYWWGLEVVIPEPSVKYLSNTPSIAHTVINFLTALSVGNGGVREILPFVRYISQYIDGEFSLIKQQDHGQGVVCAATWIMPAALVPRPWDFPPPPPPSASQPAGSDTTVPGSPPPDPNHAPLAAVPTEVVTGVQTEDVPGNPEEGVPGVTVIPPTPPVSETLGRAAGAAFEAGGAVDKVGENGIATVATEGGSKQTVSEAVATA